jgi:hypothetical protein
MRKKTKSKKTKQKQKQKQSQNVRQTVTVNLGNTSKRRPQRRSGTRTAPLVTYQQMPIPLGPSIDFGKLEHTISSLKNNILHSINNRQNNNLISTPPIQTPTPKSNLMTGLHAAEREEEQRQISDDRAFSSFTAQKEAEDVTKKLKDILKKQATPVVIAESRPARGRPRADTQRAEPLSSYDEGSVAGGGGFVKQAQAEEVQAPKPRGRPALTEQTKLERQLMKKEDRKKRAGRPPKK